MRKICYCLVLLSLLFSGTTAQSQAHQRIINGIQAGEETPWMVSLSPEWLSPSEGHFCGGTLIDASWVVTAAHCVQELRTRPQSIRISYGVQNLYNVTLQSSLADGIIVHEGYDENTLVNDIALIHLSVPVANARPMPVAADSQLSFPVATVFGWGLTQRPVGSEVGQISPTLQQASIPVQSDARCTEVFGESYNKSTMLCAGILSSGPKVVDGVDSCSGDSGGPLVSLVNGVPSLVGIVSWGAQCADNRTFGVYTRVSSFTDWLNKPRILPAYFKNGVKIKGRSVVGAKLTCSGDSLAGSVADTSSYRWVDAETGSVIGKGQTLRVHPSLAGQKIKCSAELSNSGGSTETFSHSTYRIAGERALKTFRPKSPVLSTAEVRCSGSKCRVDVLTNYEVSNLWTYFTPSTCAAGNCARRVKLTAKKSTDNSWVIEWNRSKFAIPTKSTKISVRTVQPVASALTVSL